MWNKSSKLWAADRLVPLVSFHYINAVCAGACNAPIMNEDELVPMQGPTSGSLQGPTRIKEFISTVWSVVVNGESSPMI